jgi:3-hydroxyisobutyrate dehydrogenase-like beta-hydroxyacid dehydrogenase
MSTVGPSAVRTAARRLAPVAVLDAPVLGSVPHAETGTLTILAGGDADVLARHEALLGILGRVVHAGPAGAGATLKLVANALTISALVGVGEALALTDRAGLDPEAVLDVLQAGPVGSLIERWRPRIVGDIARADFRLALARKDLGLANDEAAALGLEPVLARAAAGRLEDAMADGQSDADLAAVVAIIRRTG